jgi:hypothetical protein
VALAVFFEAVALQTFALYFYNHWLAQKKLLLVSTVPALTKGRAGFS